MKFFFAIQIIPEFLCNKYNISKSHLIKVKLSSNICFINLYLINQDYVCVCKMYKFVLKICTNIIYFSIMNIDYLIFAESKFPSKNNMINKIKSRFRNQ